MRIGTWNMEGKGSAEHRALLEAQQCDVWLLTEVPESLRLPALTRVAGTGPMTAGKLWAAVYARSGRQVPSPHPATAIGEVDGWTFASTVLPWAGSGGQPPWSGADHPARVQATLDALRSRFGEQLVWGGDWNHGLLGLEKAGSGAGRAAVQGLLTELGLQVPTATLAHRIPGLFSIDHVAVPVAARSARQVPAGGLSDHDAYVVEVDLPA